MKHKHYDMILAWATGETLEYWSATLNQWVEFTNKNSIDWNFEPTKYRIKPEPQPDVVVKRLEADIDLLWAVNSADIEALEDARATLEILKNKAPIKYQSMIYQSLSLIYTALGMSHSDAFQRIIDKARGVK